MADNRLVLRLYNAQQGHQAIGQAWAHAKGYLMASGAPMVLEVRPETRSDRQNRLLHALFGDVARQAEWMGKKRTPAEWKLLFVSGHAVATKQGATVWEDTKGMETPMSLAKRHMAKALHGIDVRVTK